MLSGVDIEDGRLVVTDARHSQPVVVDGIKARLDAPALAGPYKVEGTARADGDTFTIKAATGAADGPPAWATAMKRRQAMTQGANMASHTLKGGDSHGGGSGPDISDKS